MNPEFQVHLLNADGLQKANAVSEEFDRLLEKLKILCPEGREFSIVKTKLEEASFFAKKSVAKSPENQSKKGD